MCWHPGPVGEGFTGWCSSEASGSPESPGSEGSPGSGRSSTRIDPVPGRSTRGYLGPGYSRVYAPRTQDQANESLQNRRPRPPRAAPWGPEGQFLCVLFPWPGGGFCHWCSGFGHSEFAQPPTTNFEPEAHHQHLGVLRWISRGSSTWRRVKRV